MANSPLDPEIMFTTAVACHEMYLSYCRAGFAPDQALYLLGCSVRGAREPQPPSPDPGASS